MMAETGRLRHIIPVADPAGIGAMMPGDWGGNGYPNVCLALMVDTADEAALERIEKFKEIPAACRMLALGPEALRLDLAGRLGGIHWLAVDCGPLPTSPADDDPALKWSLALRDACQESRVAFYCHSDGEATDLEGRDWLESPFGEKVDLAREPMPGSKRMALNRR